MHLTLVGLSHKTAPVEIREKLTFPANRQEEALSLLTSTPAVSEAVIVSTCNRTEIYAVTSTEFDGPRAVIDFMCDYHGLERHDARPLALHLGRRGGHPPPLPRGGLARLDGSRRSADPRPGEGGLRALLRERRIRARLQQALPPVLRGRQARANRDRHRRERRLHQLRRGRTRQEGLRDARRPHHPGARRRQDERAHGQAPGEQRREEGPRRQPHLRARAGARREVRRRGHRLRGALRPHGRGRHRHLVDRGYATTSSPRTRSPRPARAARAARCSSSTSRFRATSTRPSTTWPTSTSTTSTISTASSRRTSRSACTRPSAPRSSSARR